MSKPHVVLIPGGWHGPLYMDQVNQKLEADGYKVHARQFPAIGNPNPCPDLSEDNAAAQALVTEAIGDGNDVIVVAHSWGGVVASDALVGYGKAQREKEGKKGGVVRVGYMSAFIVDEGMSLDSWTGGPAPWYEKRGNNFHVKDGNANILYNDLPESEQQHWFSLLSTQAVPVMDAKVSHASWKEIPTAFMLCEDDQAIPPPAQEAMIKFAQDKGAKVDVTRIKSGHSPFLSKIPETVSWIEGLGA